MYRTATETGKLKPSRRRRTEESLAKKELDLTGPVSCPVAMMSLEERCEWECTGHAGGGPVRSAAQQNASRPCNFQMAAETQPFVTVQLSEHKLSPDAQLFPPTPYSNSPTAITFNDLLPNASHYPLDFLYQKDERAESGELWPCILSYLAVSRCPLPVTSGSATIWHTLNVKAASYFDILVSFTRPHGVTSQNTFLPTPYLSAPWEEQSTGMTLPSIDRWNA